MAIGESLALGTELKELKFQDVSRGLGRQVERPRAALEQAAHLHPGAGRLPPRRAHHPDPRAEREGPLAVPVVRHHLPRLRHRGPVVRAARRGQLLALADAAHVLRPPPAPAHHRPLRRLLLPGLRRRRQAAPAALGRAFRCGSDRGADRHPVRHHVRQVRALDLARHGPQHRRPPLLGALELVLLPRRLLRRLHDVVPRAARLLQALAVRRLRQGPAQHGAGLAARRPHRRPHVRRPVPPDARRVQGPLRGHLLRAVRRLPVAGLGRQPQRQGHPGPRQGREARDVALCHAAAAPRATLRAVAVDGRPGPPREGGVHRAARDAGALQREGGPADGLRAGAGEAQVPLQEGLRREVLRLPLPAGRQGRRGRRALVHHLRHAVREPRRVRARHRHRHRRGRHRLLHDALPVGGRRRLPPGQGAARQGAGQAQDQVEAQIIPTVACLYMIVLLIFFAKYKE